MTTEGAEVRPVGEFARPMQPDAPAEPPAAGDSPREESPLAAPAELLIKALPEAHTWLGRPTADDLAALPGSPAVYLLVDDAGRPIQLATTQALKRLLLSRLVDLERKRPGQADLAEIARGVRWRTLLTPFEGRWWFYRLARVMHPREYRRLVSFGPAWFLQVDWAAPIAEIRVTEHIWESPGEFVGPWPAHKGAQEALHGLCDLFDLCRYPEQVRRRPHGKRCAYAEMGRCDAPCDGSAPLPRYTDRCRAAWRFATGQPAEWINAAEARMRAAATALNFELAAQIKQQLRFAEHWRTQWARHVRPASQLHFVAALPATRRKAWKVFLFRAGELVDGPVLPDRKLVGGLDAWIRGLGSPQDTAPQEDLARSDGADGTTRMEQTWLFSHLLFSREAERAILLPLQAIEEPGLQPRLPADYAERVAARVAELRQKPADDEAAGD